MTKREAAAAIKAWAVTHWPDRTVRSVRHVHHRAYVMARPAPKALYVLAPWVDSEPHLREWDREYGCWSHVNEFDETLRAGDWCAVGYVAADGYQVHVAVPLTCKQAVAIGRAPSVDRQQTDARGAADQKQPPTSRMRRRPVKRASK